MSDVLAASPLVRAIGVGLIEFLWQGALIALVAGAALRALRGSEPTTRYAVALLTLLAMACVPVATAVVAYRSTTAPLVTADGGAVAIAALSLTAMPASTLAGVLAREQWMPAIVLLWGIGVTLSGLHLAASWLLIGIVRRGASRLSQEAHRQVTRLAGQLGIRRRVRIAESTRVVVPTVMGWIRPLILVPASTLAGLSPKQLEAILVHELAHVRRHDYVVNVAQGVVETLFFYHPAVWWMSRRIRAERELCCDDLVVGTCGDRLTYARALAELESHRLRMPALAVAANGGDLMNRITRLLGAAPADRSATPIGGVLAVLAAVPFLVVGQTAASARTPVSLAEMPTPPPATAVAVQPPPPILARDVDVEVQDAAEQARNIQSRYGALLDRYRAALAYSTQNAQNAQTAGAVPSSSADEAARRQMQAIEQLTGLIRTTQQMIEAGRLTDASALLTRISELVARLPPPPPPPPPPPTGAPTLTEQAAANYAQGLVGSGGAGATPMMTGAPIRIGGNVAAPAKIRNVDPVYPESAKASGVQGIVIIECVIDQGGNVVETRVLRGVPSLNEAAIQAVSQWKYTATSLGGNPVPVIMTVTVNFTLN